MIWPAEEPWTGHELAEGRAGAVRMLWGESGAGGSCLGARSSPEGSDSRGEQGKLEGQCQGSLPGAHHQGLTGRPKALVMAEVEAGIR